MCLTSGSVDCRHDDSKEMQKVLNRYQAVESETSAGSVKSSFLSVIFATEVSNPERSMCIMWIAGQQ